MSKVKEIVKLTAIAHPLTIVASGVGWDGFRIVKAGQEANMCAL